MDDMNGVALAEAPTSLALKGREVVFAAPDVVVVRAFAPPTLAPDQVRVASLLSGLSHGTELNLLRGSAPGFHRNWDETARAFRESEPHKRFPVTPGYETVGVITEVGAAVDGVVPGDRVWIDRPHRSEHVVSARDARAGLLPEGLEPEQGIFAALARVALGGIHDARIQLGERVLIVGAGAIGLIATQLAKLSGASEVYVMDVSERRLALARQFGAKTIDARAPNRVVDLKTQIGGVDVALDASGRYEGLHDAIAACVPGGRVAAVSSYQGDGAGLRLGEEFHRNRITLCSSMTVNGAPHRDHPLWDLARLNATARRLLQERRIDVAPLLTHTFEIEEAAEAYRLAGCSGDCVKIAFRYRH